MLISKKSPRESKLFRSRFGAGEGGDFALRQYHRCHEEFSSSLVHLGLQLAFAVLLVLFGRAVWHLFNRHGGDLSYWYRVVCMGLVVALLVSVFRRMWFKFREAIALRAEIRHYRSLLRSGLDEPCSRFPDRQ